MVARKGTVLASLGAAELNSPGYHWLQKYGALSPVCNGYVRVAAGGRCKSVNLCSTAVNLSLGGSCCWTGELTGPEYEHEFGNVVVRMAAEPPGDLYRSHCVPCLRALSIGEQELGRVRGRFWRDSDRSTEQVGGAGETASKASAGAGPGGYA